MSKHTPGPWEAVLDEDSNTFYVRGDNKGICGLYPLKGSIEANAALIAASPDLLAACREVLSMNNEQYAKGSIPKNFGDKVTEILYAAIAKAEGEKCSSK